MKKAAILLFCLTVQSVLLAQDFFPEGTKWTEIRLDTLMYGSWYSKSGDEWVPNFETVEYYVKGDSVSKWPDIQRRYSCVFTTGPSWADSLSLMINETTTADDVYIGATTPNLLDEFVLPAEVYQMKWSVGKELYYRDVIESNVTSSILPHTYGTIEKIEEGVFGGTRPLQYVDLQDLRIIHGIGVTEWKDGECLFGPMAPYKYSFYQRDAQPEERHYRSMLVHFERNGEVLYDLWPSKAVADGVSTVSNTPSSEIGVLYNLQGQKVQPISRKGIYILHGKKYSLFP